MKNSCSKVMICCTWSVVNPIRQPKNVQDTIVTLLCWRSKAFVYLLNDKKWTVHFHSSLLRSFNDFVLDLPISMSVFCWGKGILLMYFYTDIATLLILSVISVSYNNGDSLAKWRKTIVSKIVRNDVSVEDVVAGVVGSVRWKAGKLKFMMMMIILGYVHSYRYGSCRRDVCFEFKSKAIYL
jgi:hypothetical protein